MQYLLIVYKQSRRTIPLSESQTTLTASHNRIAKTPSGAKFKPRHMFIAGQQRFRKINYFLKPFGDRGPFRTASYTPQTERSNIYF